MKLRGTLDTITGWATGTPLHRPAKKLRDHLDDLAEARERRAERPDSLRILSLKERLSLLMFRAGAKLEPGTKNFKRMPERPDLPQHERRMALYSAAMAAFRYWAVNTRDQFTLSDPLALWGFLETAGFEFSPSDERTPQWALSRAYSRLNGRPEIMFNPSPEIRCTLNHRFSHELFHQASPLGGGLCKDGHVREILANRFAVEWANPLPGLIYSAETDAALALDRPFAFEEVMRLSRRPMFSITVPANGDGRVGGIVVQGQGGSAPRRDQGIASVQRSWDNLVLWSKPGDVNYYPPDISWLPRLFPADERGFVNLQTVDGLYHVRPGTESLWLAFSNLGIVDPESIVELSPGMIVFDVRDLPEIAIEGSDGVIEAGRYLVLRMLRDVIPYPEPTFRRTHQVLAIKDDNNYLHRAWEQAASRREPRFGPLLPPLDPQRHEHLVPFNNWWHANRDWRELTFDRWAGMITDKFMRDLSAVEQEQRRTLEAAMKADAESGQLEPGFVVE